MAWESAAISYCLQKRSYARLNTADTLYMLERYASPRAATRTSAIM